jgi:hypothetical protein
MCLVEIEMHLESMIVLLATLSRIESLVYISIVCSATYCHIVCAKDFLVIGTYQYLSCHQPS